MLPRADDEASARDVHFVFLAEFEAGTDLFTDPVQLARWAAKKGLLFYDYSPNRSARWCLGAVVPRRGGASARWCQPRCGELLNTRAGRRRQRRTRSRR